MLTKTLKLCKLRSTGKAQTETKGKIALMMHTLANLNQVPRTVFHHR